MPSGSESQDGLDIKISVSNFGPIASGSLDFRPLTVLVGPSGTGKTYLATLLYALHRSFSGFARHPFSQRHSVSAIDFTTPEDLNKVFQKLSQSDRSFTLADLPAEVQVYMKQLLSDSGYYANQMHGELRRCLSPRQIEDLVRWDNEANSFTLALEVSDSGQHFWSFNMEVPRTGEDNRVRLFQESSIHSQIHNPVLIPSGKWNRHTLIELLETSIPNHFDRLEKLRLVVNEVLWATGSLPEKNIHYLPAARSGLIQFSRLILNSLVHDSTNRTPIGLVETPAMLGTVADFIGSLILRDGPVSSRDEYSYPFRNRTILRDFVRPPMKTLRDLATDLEQKMLSGSIDVRYSELGRLPEFRFRPDGVQHDLSLGRSSSMVAELAPLFLFLRSTVKQGDTIILEEPEAHLHPKSQAMMARTLAYVVQAGVRIVVTTHSDWFLKEIGNLILEGQLQSSPEYTPTVDAPEPCSLRRSQVGVWHFSTDANGNNPKIEEVPFDYNDGVEPREFEVIAEYLYNRAADLRSCIQNPQRTFRR